MGLNAPPRYRPPSNGTAKSVPTERIDQGPPYPGYNCHIVIDGVGYIFADIGSATQESQKEASTEDLAPFFGNAQNPLDTLSSDMTMLLPIGQNDFSGGIGGIDLEKTPTMYERGENLMLTPQNTLINGPRVVFEGFTGNPNPSDARGYQEGYFGGTTTASGAANTYFGIGGYLYNRNDVARNWSVLPCRFPVTDIFGYSARLIVGYGPNGGDIFYGVTPYVATHYIYKSFILNSNPFIINRDGRIYSAFIMPPDNVTVTDETGPDTNALHYAYAATYVIKLPDNTWVSTGLGPLAFGTKLPNKELVIGLPNRGYKGGPVCRRLYRSLTNALDQMYLIADETVTGPNMTRFVDTVTDAVAATKPVYDWTQINNTGIVPLIAGEITRNMQFPDSHPIWLPQTFVPPASSDFITRVVTFHDAQGNEGAAIGTTSGLFSWNGLGLDFQTLRLTYYHPLNFKYMAVNHGAIYYTLMGHTVYLYTPEKSQELRGPWLSQYNTIDEIRLMNNSNYVSIAVTGNTKYAPTLKTCTVYLFNGTAFAWSQSWVISDSTDAPVLGGVHNSDMLAWWKGRTSAGVSTMALDPLYTDYHTTGVLFRSAGSDADLPRLRKQVHAVMVRYLRLSPNQPQTILSEIAAKGDTFVHVADITGFAIGDWIRISGNGNSLTQHEYRKVTSIGGGVIGYTHTLGAGLIYEHDFGCKVQKCAAVTKLRNVFTEGPLNLPTQDIEVGGPCDSGELFAYIRLPQPVYTYSDGIEISWNTGVVMELQGWAMLTGLNPMWNGLMDLHIRLQDNIKLPNNLYDNALASQRQDELKTAYNKGTVDVIDPLGVERIMRFQRLNFTYEEPKERHADLERMQATATVRLIDQMAELQKQSELVLNLKSQ